MNKKELNELEELYEKLENEKIIVGLKDDNLKLKLKNFIFGETKYLDIICIIYIYCISNLEICNREKNFTGFIILCILAFTYIIYFLKNIMLFILIKMF